MSLPNSLLQIWAARLASKIALCSAMTYDLYQLSKTRGKDGTLRMGITDDKRRHLATAGVGAREGRTVEDVFIRSLVAAGACKQHHATRPMCGAVGWRTRPVKPARPARRLRDVSYVSTRQFSTPPRKCQAAAAAAAAAADTAQPPSNAFTPEEYNDLVDTYKSFSVPGEGPGEEPVPTPPHHSPLAPRLVIPPEQEAQLFDTTRHILPPEDPDHATALTQLHALLSRRPGYISHAGLWSQFEQLRRPRLRYIADDDIRRAFRHLSWVEFKSAEQSMPRYLALLDECLAEGIPVTTEEWNTAIAFAGRWVRRVTSAEVKGAVEMWLRMEEHGPRADHVTFNILFDVAVKAGRFALADTIFNELRMREMPLNRFFRTSVIYYAGMRGDGDGVRQAFRDLVNGGDIVDTAIMNCVILSLVRAGEPAAAEHVFEKMKRLVKQKMGTDGPLDWREQKEVGVLLHRAAQRLRWESQKHQRTFSREQGTLVERREEIQKLTPLKPNPRTYRILIQHHVHTSGDLNRVKELVTEMHGEGLPMTGSVYVHLFRGFWTHGGSVYSSWDREQLEDFWASFLAAARASAGAASPFSSSSTIGPPTKSPYEAEASEGDKAPCYTKGLVQAVIRAFYKCVGKKRMLEVWARVEEEWVDVDYEERMGLERLVDRLCQEDSVYIV